MKNYFEIFKVNAINIGAILFAENIQGINVVEIYMRIFVLLATLIYTSIKIYNLIKRGKKSELQKDDN